jgi:hypothetical protein
MALAERETVESWSGGHSEKKWVRRQESCPVPDQWTKGHHHKPSTSPAAPTINAGPLFTYLRDQWKARSKTSSSVNDMVLHPAYQRIIGMGVEALPFILRELEREPDHWFWALRSITGQDPVPPESRGRLKEMTRCWLEWGKKNRVY